MRTSPLSNWPRYPGGIIGGILVAALSVAVFVADAPALRHVLRAVQGLAVVLWGLWVLRAGRSGD